MGHRVVHVTETVEAVAPLMNALSVCFWLVAYSNASAFAPSRSLVCFRMRLDLQLSRVLLHFRGEFEAGAIGTQRPTSLTRARSAIISTSSKALGSLLKLGSGRHSYRRLEEDSVNAGARHLRSSQQGARGQLLKEMHEVLSFLTQGRTHSDLVALTLDLTFYEHRGLASASLALLAQAHENAKDLDAKLSRTQLLLVPSMIAMHGSVDDLLRQLKVLTDRAVLFDDEMYLAAKVLNKLTEVRAHLSTAEQTPRHNLPRILL
eukprot:6207422-Pleurochrysis_carterae.AAC.2